MPSEDFHALEMHFPHPHMPPRNCRHYVNSTLQGACFFHSKRKTTFLIYFICTKPIHRKAFLNSQDILSWTLGFSQECFWERTLHFVEFRAFGPDIGDDLSTMMSAEGGRCVYLGVTPPPWLWVLGIGKNPMESWEARPPQEGSSLMAQVSWVQELRTLQLDVRPRGTKGCWVHQRDAKPKISKRWCSEILDGHPLTKTELFKNLCHEMSAT